MNLDLHFDYIVVGGGSSGSVMAARLSENPLHRVLLLEAGPDYADPASVPQELLDGNLPVMSGHNWDLSAQRRSEGLGEKLAQLGRVAKVFQAASGKLAMARTAPSLIGGKETLNRMAYPMGKVVGGSSAINGALAMHAREQDFAEWAERGNPFWRWLHVAPWIARLRDGWEGEPGFPIEPTGGLTALQSAFADACTELGLQERLRTLQKTTRGGQRASTAAVYLEPARKRGNLQILPGACVDKVCLSRRGEQLVADGVDVLLDGQRRTIKASQVVLCAGAVNTPAILARSGIGSRMDLERLGIAPLADLPGVGANLQDHPVVSIWGVPADGAYQSGESIHQLMLELRSSRFQWPDLQLLMLSAVPTECFKPLDELIGGPRASGITVMLSKPASTGTVSLVSADPLKAPSICLNLLQRDIDLHRMREGVRQAWTLMRTPALAERHERVVMWNDSLLASDARLDSALHATVRAAWHPVGTARMGPDTDPAAVTDEYGSVHGCTGLSVADASLMPTIPSVPTNLSCVLIAERIAGVLNDRAALRRRVA